MREHARWSTVVFSCALAVAVLAGQACGGSGRGTGTSTGTGTAGEPGTLAEVFEGMGLGTAPEPDKVVATVEGEEITARRVYELARVNKMAMAAEGKPLPEGLDIQMLRGSLQVLIDSALMIRAARDLGLPISPEAVEAEVQTARAQFPTEEEYQDYLAGAGLTVDDVRREAEGRVLMQAYMKSVQPEPVAESEARKFYDEKPDFFMEGEKVRAAQIWIKSPRQDPPAKREEAKKRIDMVYQKLLEGEDFGELAKEYSHGPTAGRGGDLGFFGRGQMVPKFENASFSTEVGKFSEVFETPYGYHVVKVLDRRDSQVKPFEEVKAYILMQLSRQQEGAVLAGKLQELRAAAKVEILDPELDPAKLLEDPEEEAEEVAEAPSGGDDA